MELTVEKLWTVLASEAEKLCHHWPFTLSDPLTFKHNNISIPCFHWECSLTNLSKTRQRNHWEQATLPNKNLWNIINTLCCLGNKYDVFNAWKDWSLYFLLLRLSVDLSQTGHCLHWCWETLHLSLGLSLFLSPVEILWAFNIPNAFKNTFCIPVGTWAYKTWLNSYCI